MAANARVVAASNSAMAAVVAPTGVNTPTVQAAVLVDGSGNLIKAVDNGDGTATLASQVSVAVEPAATSLSVNVSASAVVSATAKDYRGFSLRESTGSATALVRIFDHASAASGTVLDEVSLSAAESAREFYGDGGKKTSNGIYYQVVSGSVIGSICTGA